MLSGLLSIVVVCAPAAAGSGDIDDLLQEAITHRREGNLRIAIELLEHARAGAGPACPARILGELGAAYAQASRLTEADQLLATAYRQATDPAERALFANDLGTLSARRGEREEAIRYYEEARESARGHLPIAVSAGLNLARLAPPELRFAQLAALSDEIAGIGDRRERARYLVNLGSQARALGMPGAKLAYEALEPAKALAIEIGDRWLAGEAMNELAQLYEDHGRAADALALTEGAVFELRSERSDEVMVELQWRRGRLLRAQGNHDFALRAYQSAVDQVEAIRQDIPVEYADGRSSFRTKLEPIYLGLADLLLERAATAGPGERAQLLRRAQNTIELVKQIELQDYLGDRCLVESTRPLRGTALPAHTAVLYPVILERRLALLLETTGGIEVHNVSAAASMVHTAAQAFSAELRNLGPDYLGTARALYDMLIRPIEPALASNRVDTLVVVPDGVLRLLPMGALHDGEHFVIERLAIVTAPGLSITSAQRGAGDRAKLLLAGLAKPGPTLEQLPQQVLDQLMLGEAARGTRSADLRERLALPGVGEEIRALEARTHGDRLLDSEFTVDRFFRQAGSGNYGSIHIASHAVFGRSAQTSFILAYDGLVTIDALQTLLRGDEVQRNPIDLISLSACQTAEGDDRAPLGIAGAALRARVNSALGALWSVDDEATTALMVQFYEFLTRDGHGKAQALRRAQLQLLRNQTFGHPYFWAPFILVGNWE